MKLKLKVKYHDEKYKRLKEIEEGDWIDLRLQNLISVERWDEEKGEMVKTKNTSKDKIVKYKAGDTLFFGLGVSIELPKGHEAHVLPRSSTFAKTGFLLTNSMGIIDCSYCGDEDEWKTMVYCTRDGEINLGERYFQFRIVKNQPDLDIVEVEKLGNKNRGGYGITDNK